jgi:tetratricopeptide (TPR) repeat protein
LKNGDYYPALLNYGNLLYLDQQYSKSLSYYLRARRMKPDDAFVTLHLSQVYAKMGNQAESDAQYRRLASLDPELASRHADLDASKSAGARAAGQLSERETMIWQE